MIIRVLLFCLLAPSISVETHAEDIGRFRNPDGTYSLPASALTDEARRAFVGGFTYQLRPGWTLKTVPGAAYKMAFGREQDGSPANISFQDVTFNGNLGQFETKTIKETATAYAAQGLTNFKVINMSAFETNANLIGLLAVTQVQRPDGKIVRQFFYFFERKDGKKVGVVCSVTDAGTTYDAEFDAIMKTFRVTK